MKGNYHLQRLSRAKIYYRGLNNYQYHLEVHLRYHILHFYKEYGTIILVII